MTTKTAKTTKTVRRTATKQTAKKATPKTTAAPNVQMLNMNDLLEAFANGRGQMLLPRRAERPSHIGPGLRPRDPNHCAECNLLAHYHGLIEMALDVGAEKLDGMVELAPGEFGMPVNLLDHDRLMRMAADAKTYLHILRERNTVDAAPITLPACAHEVPRIVN